MGDSADHGGQSHAAAAPGGPARVTAFQLIAVGVPSFFVGVIGTLVVWAVTRSEWQSLPHDAPPPDRSADAPALAASSPTGTRMGTSGPVNVEDEARRALARFRDGIGACVRDVIGVLPGTSPAVPVTMKLMKNGVYTGAASDYKTPVYACARYAESGPQRYQIQWQIGSVPTEGLGIAWVDDDGDGDPDRAFGFTAKLVKKKEVTFGEIGPLSPAPKVLPAR